MMSYKDYLGSVEFDEDERIFHGKLEFIRALICTRPRCRRTGSCLP